VAQDVSCDVMYVEHEHPHQAIICSSLYLILQTVPFWRWPVCC
jgi:hypothetical protein